MDAWFWTDWDDVGRTAASAVMIYVVVIASIRLNGLRSLAKASAFDFAVTVAIGTIISSVMLSQSVPATLGAVSILVLFGLQRIVSRLRRNAQLHRLIDNQPVAVMRKGEVCRDVLAEVRLSESDLRAALRSAGVAHRQSVAAVVFEATGELSVVRADENVPVDPWLLEDLRDPEV